MSTDNADSSASDLSVEQRLAAYVQTSAPEAAADEQQDGNRPPSDDAAEQASGDVQDDGTDEAEGEQQEADGDLIDFEADDGTVLKVPAKLKPALERQADYTRKTQEVATLRRAAEDRMQFAEMREKVLGAVLNEATQLRTLEARKAEYDAIDIGSLYDSSPGQALRIQQQQNALEKQINDLRQAIGHKVSQAEQAGRAHASQQWKLAEEGAMQRLGKVSQADNAAMEAQVRALGFDPEEFKARFPDPRIIHAVYKAAKWDALQAGKPTASAKVAKAPPIVRPGASKGAGVAAMSQYKAARDELRRTGSDAAAARLLSRFK